YPDLHAYIEQRYEREAIFPASIGDGEVSIWKRKNPARSRDGRSAALIFPLGGQARLHHEKRFLRIARGPFNIFSLCDGRSEAEVKLTSRSFTTVGASAERRERCGRENCSPTLLRGGRYPPACRPGLQGGTSCWMARRAVALAHPSSTPPAPG